MSLPSINFLQLTVSERYHGQDFQIQGQCGKVKFQIKVTHHDVVHLHPLTNVPTKDQLPTPFSFSDTAWTNFSEFYRFIIK